MALLIDGLILTLLAGTLGYAFLVDRRVRALMAALEDLRPMVGQFSAAVDKSETSARAMVDAARRNIDRSQPVLRSPAPQSAESGPRAPASPAPVTAAPPAATSAEGAPLFSSSRGRDVPGGVTRVRGKSDMVRSFFEASRSRSA